MKTLLLLAFLFLFNVALAISTGGHHVNVFIAGVVFGLLNAELVALLRKKK